MAEGLRKQHTKPQVETHVITTNDGDIKVTQPKGTKHHRVTVLFEPDDLVREQVNGFVRFLRDHAIVGLAIGFIIGQQAQTLIKQLVDSFVTPLLEVWLGQNLANKQFVLHSGKAPIAITWGQSIYVIINFLFILLFVYIIIRVFKLDNLDNSKVKK